MVGHWLRVEDSKTPLTCKGADIAYGGLESHRGEMIKSIT